MKRIQDDSIDLTDTLNVAWQRLLLVFALMFTFGIFASEAQDADNDGIVDVIDLDDDNDGILDTEEYGNCATGFQVVNFTEDFGAGGRVPGLYTNYCYEDGTGTAPCTAFPGNINVNDGEYAIVQHPNPDASTFGTWTTDGDHTGDANGRMMVVNASIAADEFYRRTIDIFPNVDVYSEVWIRNVINPGVGLILPNVLISMEDTLGNVLSSLSTGDIAEDGSWHLYSLTANPGNLTKVQIVYTNNTGGGSGNDLALDDISSWQILCDFDNDMIADYLDLDSDNDGCADAIEGDSTFTTADIQNDTLTGGVDANGIPNVVSPVGQGIGLSQDSTMNTCNTPPIAIDDSETTAEDTPVSVDVLDLGTADSDLESNILITSVGSTSGSNDGATSEGGTVTINNNTTPSDSTDDFIVYDPATGYIGSDTFYYVITDAGGLTDTAQVLITVSEICNITNIGLSAETCNDNNTDAITTDDYISFSINPMGSGLGSGFSLSVDSGGSFVGGNTGSYGSATSFRLQDGAADNTLFTVTITDDVDGSCVFSFTVQQGPCSVCQAGAGTLNGIGNK